MGTGDFAEVLTCFGYLSKNECENLFDIKIRAKSFVKATPLMTLLMFPWCKPVNYNSALSVN